MGTADYAWLVSPRAEVIDADHPDYAYWHEAHEIEQWVADGAPPVESPPPPLPRTPSRPDVPAVALALSREQAAAALNVSVDFLDAKVMPGLRVVTEGRRILIPVRELEAWLEARAARALRG